MTGTAPRPWTELTAGDWLAASVGVLCALFCLQFPLFAAPRFAKMFEDFGGELPALTRLGLTYWFPWALAVLPIALAATGLARARTVVAARIALLLGALLAIGGSFLCVLAMYQPIFAISGSIE